MKILLDTHILLWAATEPHRIGTSLELVSSAQRLISAATVWELAIKQGIGKLDLGSDVATWIGRAITELALEMVDITAVHASGVEALPPVHRDPFDRLLISQATVEGAVLLTADRALAAYGDPVRLVD